MTPHERTTEVGSFFSIDQDDSTPIQNDAKRPWSEIGAFGTFSEKKSRSSAVPTSEDIVAKNVTSLMISLGLMSIENSIDKWSSTLSRFPLWASLQQPIFEIGAWDRVWPILVTCGMKDQTRKSVEAVKEATIRGIIYTPPLSEEQKIELTEVYWTCRLGFESKSTLLAMMHLSFEDFCIKYKDDLTNLKLPEKDLQLAERYCNALRVALCILPGYMNTYKGRLVRMALRVARCENETYYLRSGNKGKFHAFLADKIFQVESEDNTLRLSLVNTLALHIVA